MTATGICSGPEPRAAGISPPLTDPVFLGQVFTPPAVARLTLVLTLDGAPEGTLLDPSCGDGAFLAEAEAMTARRVVGVEIDARHAATAIRRVPRAEIRVGDFFHGDAPTASVVVGNPPWVRQERLGADRKGSIAARLAADWPGTGAESLAGRGDLALAFVARAIRGLPPGGRLGFVLSQAVLDADYGRALLVFLERRARLVGVVASPTERWFAAAEVHAAILVVERSGAAQGASPPPIVARLRVPVETAAARVGGWRDLAAVADVRPLEAGESPGQALRAPAVWARVRPSLVPLADLADVRRGVTAGANRFFYLTRGRAAELGLARHGRPLLKTPSDAAAIRVRADTLSHVALTDLDDGDPAAAAHIAAHAELATRPSLAVRRPWWRLPAEPARLFLTKAYDVRFVQPFADEPLIADQRMYALTPRVDVELLAAVLNSTPALLAIECTGRASMGQGALELSVGDATRLPVPDPRRAAASGAVRAAFRAIQDRPVGAIFEELQRADRIALDDAVLAAFAPGLRELAPLLRDALAAAVEERLARSSGSTC